MSAPERRAYDLYQEQLHDKASMYESTYLIGEVKGFTKGHAEGKHEANHHTVLQSYKRGLAVETIADITDLSVAAVQKILREAGIALIRKYFSKSQKSLG